jgi:hypothetical protein
VAERAPAHPGIHVLVDEAHMNRIHAMAERPDEIYLPAQPSEVVSPLHLCPVSKRIVDCAENCPDCAKIAELYEAQYHARRAALVFGNLPRIDVEDKHTLGARFVCWVLSLMEDWPSWLFWMFVILATCGFWAAACYLMARHG